MADSLTHNMDLVLQPASGALIVNDRIGFDQPRASFEFRLNAGFSVRTASGRLKRLDDDPLHPLYRLSWAGPAAAAELYYQGKPLFAPTRGHGGMPQGDVSAAGVYLDGSSAWYPFSGATIAGLDLRIGVPDGWQALSAGKRSEERGRIRWVSKQPQDELYLLAGRYTRHVRRHGDIDLSVWLLQDDPALAGRYLALMGQYIDHYSDLIGPYPYAKFAVVENRWPTGLGMPSFTLLGAQVLRLPFIPYTSLPHEILHNWWGNGVWVDYGRGNWSEGLTAYLADHWMKERQGKGAEYRLRALQRYSNYAANGRDMRLLDFVSRHDEASQSVGYSKSLMYFHMLRRALGDQAFDAGLRRLWQQHRFQRIGFEQAVRTLIGERADIARRFIPWLSRKGAPALHLDQVRLQREAAAYRLDFSLAQDADPPFDIDIPVEVRFADGTSKRVVQRLNGRSARFRLDLPRRPAQLLIDSAYDVLRYLDASEQPPALNRLFGGQTWLVIPHYASAQERAAWRELAQAWQRRYPGLRVVTDEQRYGLLKGGNRIVLGWDNRLFDDRLRAAMSGDGRRLTRDGLQIGKTGYPGSGHAVVLVSSDAQGVSTAFIGAQGVQAIEALARKLPHYGSYGVLVFGRPDMRNRYKAVPENPHSRLRREL